MSSISPRPDHADPVPSAVQKLVALSGIGFAVLMVVSIILAGDSSPSFDDPVGDWSTWAEDNKDNVRLGSLAFAFATYEFILFLAVLRSTLGHAEHAARGFTRGSYAILVGGTIGVTGMLLALATAAVAAAHPDAPPEIIRAVSEAGSGGFLVAAPGFAAMFITTFILAKPTRALPAWLTWLALVTGICFLLQLLTILSDEYDNAFGMFYPARVPRPRDLRDRRQRRLLQARLGVAAPLARGLDDPDAVAVRVADREHRGGAREGPDLLVEVDAADRLQPVVLGVHVGGFDADRAAAGLAAHRRVEREARRGAGRGDLEPAHRLALAEAHVGAHLVAELVGVERERRVLVGDGEHRDADGGDGGLGLL